MEKPSVAAKMDRMETNKDGVLPSQEVPQALCQEEAFCHLQNAITSLDDLEARHSNLLKSVEDGTFDLQALRDVLESNESNLLRVRRSVEANVRDIPIENRPTTASAMRAKQVLDTAELFEQIVLCLDPRDALSAIQITKNTLGFFDDSPKLQDKLSMRRAENGFLYSPFNLEDVESFTSFANFQVNHIVCNNHQNDWGDEAEKEMPYRVTITAGFDQWDQLPNLGTRCRRMLICQPPVRVMQVIVSCCDYARWKEVPSTIPRRWALGMHQPNSTKMYGEDEEDNHLDDESIEKNNVLKSFEIKSKTGITVGDIYDATLALREAHGLCPHAEADVHDEEGRVWSDIRFHSDVTLKSDDPFIKEQARAKAQEDLDDIKEQAQKQTFGVYIRAKKISKSCLSIVRLSAESSLLTTFQAGRMVGRFRRTRSSRRSIHERKTEQLSEAGCKR